jgi:hypothetical protein
MDRLPVVAAWTSEREIATLRVEEIVSPRSVTPQTPKTSKFEAIKRFFDSICPELVN